jgi:hypothetical protein
MQCTREGLVRLVMPLLQIAGLLLAGGCTFNHAWTEAAKERYSTNSLLGSWEGTWLSEVNGHSGNLRCVVTLKDDGTYRARFHATYKKVLGFGYKVPLKATETNGVFRFNGEADLGWWAGGVYNYEGYAEDTNFFSTYRCKYDHGTFQMMRPAEITNTAARPTAKAEILTRLNQYQKGAPPKPRMDAN